MKRIGLIFLFTMICNITFSQKFGKTDDAAKYAEKDIIDPIYGIIMYENLNPQTGGDSSRNNIEGYASQGWEQDFYLTGELLHKGYYEDGQLRMYKNYYKNGTVERSFKVIDFRRCNMVFKYRDGTKKAVLMYHSGITQKSIEYYENGQIEYAMEQDKSLDFLNYRKLYQEDGTPIEIFELTNKKKQHYHQEEYHENGELMTEGNLKFNHYSEEYMKDGNWKVYDNKGKQIRTDKYVFGEKIK
jgi:hypothetical protein